MLSDSTILTHLTRQPKRQAGYKQLVRELGLHGEERRELNDRLQKMVKRGELIALDSDRYALPQAAADKNLIAGRLSMHRDGFGFVIPDAKSRTGKLKQLSGDIFIPPHQIGNAMHGDMVLVDITNVRTDGRAEGRIVRPVRRANETVVGVFHYGSRRNYVTPMDAKITQEIVIPEGEEVPSSSDGGPLKPDVGLSGGQDKASYASQSRRREKKKSADRVLGHEAASHTDWNNLEGVVVDLEITDWPSPTQTARGRVLEILGREDDFGVDVEIMIRKFHLPHQFPPAVLEEAKEVPTEIPAQELARRRDFRDFHIVTIDGETARDFDDAVLVRMLLNNNFELQVHIADVAQYVTPNSALDDEARLRGTSVYFPDRAVPMLPLELSTDICSLRPHLDRLVLSCIMEIDHQGEIVGYDLCEGVIRSAERMTYTAVSAILEGDEATREKYASLAHNFELMRDLAQILNRKRVRRGSIDFDLPEPVIEFDEHGLMKSITRSERKVANRLIEEFMLSANETVAGHLDSHRIASLYRIHEKPDAKRVYDFETIAATFGYSLGVGALPIHRVQMKSDRRSNYGTGKRPREIEIPKEVHITPRMYQKLTEKIAGKPEERILSYLMLRSLKQARYSEENLGHFALAAPTYTHFTSPIRRYPDLIVHRILKTVLRSTTGAKAQSSSVANAALKGRSSTLSNSQDGGPLKPEFGLSGDKTNQGAPLLPAVGRSGDFPEAESGTTTAASINAASITVEERRFSAALNAERKGASAPDAPSPWSKRRDHAAHRESHSPLTGPIPEAELHSIAEESSQSERRADDAERELMEWKKVKFMQDRIGEDFDALITSVTKFGFFVELTDLFVEGLVPLNTLIDDRYTYHEPTREIIGQRTRRTYRIGQQLRVLADRIDPVEKKINFAVYEEAPPKSAKRRKHR